MKTLFSVMIIFIFCQNVFSSEDRSLCKKSQDCVVSEDACYSPIAIHKKYLKLNEEKNEQERPSILCLEYKGPAKTEYVALCKQNKCTLELK